MRVWPGKPSPLGATWDGSGVNFAIFSEQASSVHLSLFDAGDPGTESHRIPLTQSTASVWHAYLPDVRPGQKYGYRVDGPFNPDHGQWFNPAKLMIDPYARALAGAVRWDDSLFPARPDDAFGQSPDPRDTAGFVPPAVVLDNAFTWGDDRPPGTPWNQTVIYECHVRGMTMQHPDVPSRHRGTYLGMASDAVIDHLTSLGVTAVELLPVHQYLDEHHLVSKGLSQYWGYNSIAFFTPEIRYASEPGEQVSEFRTMVKTLHRAGIEVILDVVYNHTGEGNHLGPMLSLRGIDNGRYYHLHADNPRHYLDFTGTGNTVKLMHPRALQLVIDSLRYWASEMHVDGFRLDLAPVLGREHYSFDRQSAFFKVIQQDPVLSRVKMISEPWDVGDGGYQLGNFPPGWAEWNDRYRNCIRRFWRGEDGQVPELASRLAGSSDVFDREDRGTEASVNFITSHDGFTLNDLVSYSQKHNLANGEDNRDGNGENFSSNWGVEGPSSSPRVLETRERMKRNFLATLVFSQGVRMMLGGDEMGRSQQGNNNAYCQDNEIGWVRWTLTPAEKELLQFTRELLEIYRSNPVLRRRRFFSHTQPTGEPAKDVNWLRPDGGEMTTDDWRNTQNHVLGMLVPAHAADELDEQGRSPRGETLLLLLNGGNKARHFVLPDIDEQGAWWELLNTAKPGSRLKRRTGLNLAAHSLILLSRRLP